jgi:hypothetical protein
MCSLLLFFRAFDAHAQQALAADYGEPYGAHVSISAGERPLSLRIVAQGETKPLEECENYCDFWALPGRYTLYTFDHVSGERRTLDFRVKRSARYSLQMGDNSARDAGLAVGITGSAAIVAGLFLTLPALLASMCEDTNCVSDSERHAATIGLGLIVAGAVATPIGFSLFSKNRTLLRPIRERAAASSEPSPSVRIGVIGVSGGLGLGGAALF